MTSSLLSIKCNEVRLDINFSACWFRNRAASTMSAADKGCWSTSGATCDKTRREGPARKGWVAEGGGVIEWDVECEVDSTGVRSACTATNQIKNVTEIFIKLDFGDQTEVEMRRTWTILLSAGTTTRTRCDVGINFLSDNIRSEVHLRREAKAYLTMVMLFSRDFEAVSVNRSFCTGICNKEQDSTIAWTKESSTARQKTIEW